MIGRESGWNPTADNPASTAAGLLQILDGPYAVIPNLKLGLRMYHEWQALGYSGWHPWRGGYPSCGIY